MGSLLKAYGQVRQGNAARKAAKFEAKQMERDALAAEAEGQAAASVSRREGRLLKSRGIAVAAGSGASVRDPTVINLLADVEAESEYNALSALYSGKSEATKLRMGARARRKEGKAAQLAGYINAASTIFDDMKRSGGGG